MKSAVLFVVFNRPDTTARVFQTIRAAKPPRLYVAADGPREGRTGEAERCALVRQLATQVNWPCKLYTLFRDTNLGCKFGVSSAINWFFEHEEQGIVLEDDILAQPSFFDFCDAMLERYKDNTEVSMVSGCNLLSKRLQTQQSYFFSRYVFIWGWATWRRTWKHYDVTMSQWPEWHSSGALQKILGGDGALELYWENTFNQVHSGMIDTWDYQWVFSCWKEGGLDIVPGRNLIENLGFGPDATHTTMETPQLLVDSAPQDLIFPLQHPPTVERSLIADQHFERLVYNIQQTPPIQTEKPMTLTSIETIHRNKTGKVSDKWASYLSYYDQLFSLLRDEPLKLLEIGVQNGGSLETWSQYFNNATLLLGCDIDPKCAELLYSDPRINIVVGDANSAATYQKVVGISSTFNIIIDDGSHKSNDIINSFINYFPQLCPGGLYVVEDTCCLYMDDFGGGVLNEFGASSFFKRLTDVINYQFWKDEVSISTYLRTFFDLCSTPAFIMDGWIESIEFRNSIICIKKALKPSHEKLGERIIVGSDAHVQNWGGQIPS
jgi:hypothetical protein